MGAGPGVKFSDSYRLKRQSGRGFSNVLFGDRHLGLLRDAVRQQKAAQAEFMPGLEPVKRLVDRTGPLQGIQQLIEIRFINHE
jgi:hypothetical protein